MLSQEEISFGSLHLSRKLPDTLFVGTKLEKSSIEEQKNTLINIEIPGLTFKSEKKVIIASPKKKRSFKSNKKNDLNSMAVTSPVALQAWKKKTAFGLVFGKKVARKFFTNLHKDNYYKDANNLKAIHHQIINDASSSSGLTVNQNHPYLGNTQFCRSFFLKFLLDNIIELKCLIANKVPLFDPNHWLKILWEVFTTLLISVNIFCYSIERSFDTEFNSDKLRYFLITILFMDTFLKLNTKYYKKGEQVLNRAKILRTFIRNSFISDLLPFVGLALLTFSGKYSPLYDLNLLLFLRMFNIIDLGKRFKELLITSDEADSIYKLSSLALKILICAHFIACLWHYTSSLSMKIGDCDINWLITKGISNSDWTIRYLYSIYWAVTTMLTVGYGDITPTNKYETLFNIFAMLLGCIMFGYCLNSIDEILKFHGRKQKLLREQMILATKMMRDKRLPKEALTKLKKYLEFVWGQEHKENPQMEKVIMSKLSSKLRDEIYLHTNVKYLRSVPVINLFSEKTLIKLSSCMKKARFSPEEYVYKEQECGEPSAYFVIEGGLDILSEKGKSNIFWKSLKANEFFGINELFTGKAPRSSVISKNFSTLFQLTRSDFLSVIQRNPEEYEKFCKLRDYEMLYDNIASHEIKCESCGYPDHCIFNCKFFSYQPKKMIVIGKYQQRRIKFGKKFRRERRRSLNTLQSKEKTYKDCEILQHIYREDEEFMSLRNLYEVQDEDFLDEYQDKADYASKSPNCVEDPKKNELKNPDEAKGSQDKEYLLQFPTSLLYLETNNNRTPSIKSNATAINNRSQRNKSEWFLNNQATLRHLSGKTDKNFKGDFTQNPEPVASITRRKHFEQTSLSIDRVKSYKFYFPHNNVEEVLSRISERSKPPIT